MGGTVRAARSYGFRPGRGCHDAIQAIYEVVKGKSPKRQWILNADLAGEAFHRIAHDHILTMLGTFPAKGMIEQWLKAGVVELLSAAEFGDGGAVVVGMEGWGTKEEVTRSGSGCRTCLALKAAGFGGVLGRVAC